MKIFKVERYVFHLEDSGSNLKKKQKKNREREYNKYWFNKIFCYRP